MSDCRMDFSASVYIYTYDMKKMVGKFSNVAKKSLLQQ